MIRQDRLQEDIETLRNITDPCHGGVTRMGFTPNYRRGVEYVKKCMQEAGLETYEDEVGNLYGVLQGEDSTAPSIVSGSHLDTVKNAGAFDGIAGVVCALEVARVLKENNIKLKHTYEVLAFTEEGTIISAIGIAVSTFMSLGLMTFLAISGQVIIEMLPQPVLDALQYLLPALFGALFMDRLLNSPIKLSLSALPIIFAVKVLAVWGAFKFLPFGGGYASIIICVASCMTLAKILCVEKKEKEKAPINKAA